MCACAGSGRAIGLVAAVLVLAASSGGVAAQSQKLNGSMLRPYSADVDEVEVTPDGRRVVYQGFSESGAFGVFSVWSRGGRPLRLDVAIPWHAAHRRISPDSRFLVHSFEGLHRVPLDGRRATRLAPRAEDFRFTTDGSGVVFSADGALFHVPLDGSAEPVRLTGPTAGSPITVFEVGGSDGATDRVGYLADAEIAGVTEVFSVPVDASAPPAKLSGDVTASVGAWFLAIAPDGRNVVFLVDGFLFSAAIDGSGTPVFLSAARIRNYGNVRISPDGRWVVSVAEPELLDTFELLAVPIDGSAPPVRLNAELAPGGDVGAFEIAPGSDRVVYLADQDDNDVTELFEVAIDGGSPPVEIDHELAAGEDVWSFVLRGERVVYRTVLDPFTSASLHAVRIGSGAPPVELSGGISASSFLVSPDGARVAFFGLEARGIRRGLFGVASEGGDPVLLDPAGRGPVGITADGERVVYESDRDVPGVFELFSVSTRGGRTPAPLHPPLAALAVADVVDYRTSPDGAHCLFLVRAETCDCDDSGRFELHGAGVDPLSDSTWIADDVGQAQFTRDGAWALFQAALSDGEDFGPLYSLRVGGVLEPLELEAAAGDPALLPDSRTVVFSKGGPLAGIHRRPIDGSAPASMLAPGAVEFLIVTPDGSRVVYQRRQGSDYELFSVLADGSGAPVQLNDVIAPRGDRRYALSLTPDGARAFYWTDQLTDAVVELFSVPVDGSASPVRVSGTLVPGGDIHFRGAVASPDSTRLVYMADALVDELVELFSAPVDGSAAPVRLNGPLPSGGSIGEYGSIHEYAVLPDASRVVYRAEQSSVTRSELFVVPIDASAPPERLNGPLVTGGDVSAFAVGPDGTVVYIADQRVDGVFELFVTATDGTGTPRLLGGRTIAEGDVRTARLSADGEHVLYTADHDHDEVVELYATPIDGGPVTKLNGHLVPGGSVHTFLTPKAADAEWLLYTADQDTATVVELYRVPLSLPRAGPERPRGR
jgi:hypothetical protein